MSVVVACGGKGAASSDSAKAAADADPLALLPGSALFVASLDVHAMYANAAVGRTVASLTDPLLPLGHRHGFDVSRDVDRLVLGGYAGNVADVAVVLSGRFDVDKIAAATPGQDRRALRQGDLRRLPDQHGRRDHDRRLSRPGPSWPARPSACGASSIASRRAG